MSEPPWVSFGWGAVLMLILASIQTNTTLAHTDYPPHSRSSEQSKFQSEPPYSGTVFIDPDIITPSDPSSLIDVTYAGRGERTMFDRRPADWIVLNAHLFDARFDDGLSAEIQVNPEFESATAAMEQANKYLITTQAKRNLSSRSGIGGVRSAT